MGRAGARQGRISAEKARFGAAKARKSGGLPPRRALLYSARFYQGVCAAMAHDDSHHVSGSMDISAHKRGYAAFITGVKWTLVFILAIMVFLAIFRTHN